MLDVAFYGSSMDNIQRQERGVTKVYSVTDR